MADEQQDQTNPTNTQENPAQPAGEQQTPTQTQPTQQTTKTEEPKTPKPSLKQRLNEKWLKLKDFYRECVRVLKVTKKPDKQEFLTIVKISGLGILAIGLIGFLIHLLKELLL